MLHTKKLASYRSVSVDTASPGKLVLMLYDGAIRFLNIASDGFRSPDFRERQEVVHNNLMKAQKIVSELQRSLNIRDGGDFAVNMFRLYDFMNAKLMEANTKKAPESIRIVIHLMTEIRDAWDQMLREQCASAKQPADMEMSA